MKKILTIIIVLVVLAVLVFWLATRTSAPTGPADTAEILGEDTTSAINEQLEGLDLGDLDAEFQQIDAELNQL
jgi:hypothetical protein